ncbi:MAG: SIMPL domain-containing protein [Leptolyngbya sp. SIOISBB]|nr:SIMPL domain-containing protein [Leptolyngbya sp. SIOISBB]
MGAMGPLAMSPAIAQEATMRVLTVTGQGQEQIQTTLAQVNLGVEVEAATAEAAQAEAARQSTEVVELLRDRNVDRLQTTGIRLNPQYRHFDDQRTLTGYIATNTVSFEVPIDTVGALLDEAVMAGATRIQGVSFRARDEAIATARDVALRNAVADAQRQAQTVLGTLNFQSEEIVGIQINGAVPPIPLPEARLAQFSDAAAATTPVIGGEQTVNATVTLQIRY